MFQALAGMFLVGFSFIGPNDKTIPEAQDNVPVPPITNDGLFHF